MKSMTIVACLSAPLLLAVAGCMGASEPEPSPAEAGAAWFGAYCVSCHGPEARGDGPVAASLDPRPADLTTLAARNGGRFDAERVAAYIDGRNAVESHGPSAMPVWGRPMDDRNERILTTETLLSTPAIHQIVEYLRTLQR